MPIGYSSQTRKVTLGVLITLTMIIGISYQNCGQTSKPAAIRVSQDNSWSLSSMADIHWENEQKARQELIEKILKNIRPDLCPLSSENEILYFDQDGKIVAKSNAILANGNLKEHFTKEDSRTASARKNKCSLRIGDWRKELCKNPDLMKDVICCGGTNDESTSCGENGNFTLSRMVSGINPNPPDHSDTKCLTEGPEINAELLVNCFDQEKNYNEKLKQFFSDTGVREPSYQCVSVDQCLATSFDKTPPGVPKNFNLPPPPPNPTDFYEVTAVYPQPIVFGGAHSCETQAALFSGFNTAIEGTEVLSDIKVSLVPYCAEITQPLDFEPPGMGGKFYKQKYLELRLRISKDAPKRYKIARLMGQGLNAFTICSSGLGIMYFTKPFYSEATAKWLDYNPKLPIAGASGVARCERAANGNWYRVFQVTDFDAN